MIRRPPRSTRTDTLFPYTTLFRSDIGLVTVLGLEPRPFRDEVGRELVGSLPADDLVERLQRRGIIPAARGRDRGLHRAGLLPDRPGELSRRTARSEERRVGKECVSPFISRWCPSH